MQSFALAEIRSHRRAPTVTCEGNDEVTRFANHDEIAQLLLDSSAGRVKDQSWWMVYCGFPVFSRLIGGPAVDNVIGIRLEPPAIGKQRKQTDGRQIILCGTLVNCFGTGL